MDSNLGTTNVFLGIMAVVSVIQMLVLVVAAVVGYRQLRKLNALLKDYEHRHVDPLSVKATEILADVKGVTARVSQESERADVVLRNALGVVDEATTRVRANMQATLGVTTAVIGAARAVVDSLTGGGKRERRPPPADPDDPPPGAASSDH